MGFIRLVCELILLKLINLVIKSKLTVYSPLTSVLHTAMTKTIKLTQ